jgi:hypothetical protein
MHSIVCVISKEQRGSSYESATRFSTHPFKMSVVDLAEEAAALLDELREEARKAPKVAKTHLSDTKHVPGLNALLCLSIAHAYTLIPRDARTTPDQVVINDVKAAHHDLNEAARLVAIDRDRDAYNDIVTRMSGIRSYNTWSDMHKLRADGVRK